MTLDYFRFAGTTYFNPNPNLTTSPVSAAAPSILFAGGSSETWRAHFANGPVFGGYYQATLTFAFPNWGNSMPGWLYTPVMTAPPAGTDPASANGLLYPYVRKTPPYRCPLDTVTGPYWLARANKFSTYVMNGAVCGYGSLLNSSYRLNQFKPEAYCLWEPDEDNASPPIGAFAYNDASAFPDRNEGPGRKHQGGTPIGTFGGAAGFSSMVRWKKWPLTSAISGAAAR